jgi:hypothetical protein
MRTWLAGAALTIAAGVCGGGCGGQSRGAAGMGGGAGEDSRGATGGASQAAEGGSAGSPDQPDARAGTTANPSGEGSGGVATVVPDSEPEAELGEFGCGADPAAKPVEIVAMVRSTFDLAIAGDLLYFMEYSELPDARGRIGRVAVGGGEVEYIVRDLDGWAPMVVAGTSLFFNSNSGLARLPLNGGTPEIIDRATPSSLATWDSRLYWCADTASSNTVVFKGFPSLEDAPSPELTLEERIDVVTALAATASVVYFTSYFGELGGVSMTTGKVRVFPRALYFPATALAVNSTGVYYTAGTLEDRNRTVILKASLDGDERRIVARGGGDDTEIAVDDEYIYFVDWNDGSPDPLACVKKKPLAGGAPTLVATWPDNHGFGLTIDETHVYFSDSNTIMRAPK